MAGVVTRWRMAEFVAISNAVNEGVCKPLAQKVAGAVSDEKFPGLSKYIHVTTDPRSGLRDWAHSRVVNAHPKAMSMEARRGVMARALGSA